MRTPVTEGTPAVGTPAADEAVTGAWHALLGRIGPPAECRPLANVSLATPDAEEPGTVAMYQLDIRELFVGAGPAKGGRPELLCVALLERAGPDGEGAGPTPTAELVVLGSEAMRGRTTPNANGFTVTDMRLGGPGPAPRSLSLALFRMPGRPRAHDLAASVEDLGRLLDYRHDPSGSATVAQAVVRRLGTLRTVPGVTVPVAGTAYFPLPHTGHETYRLLAPRDTALWSTAQLAVRQGRLTAADGGEDAALADGDGRPPEFVVLRAGRARPRHGELRDLDQFRREHYLAGTEWDPVSTPDEEETWGARTIRGRQSVRAEQLIRLAVSEERSAAHGVYRTALTQPGADGPFAESLASRVTTVEEYWLVDDALRAGGAPAPGNPGERAVHEKLGERLDQLLGLIPEDPNPAVVTPFVLEVRRELASSVDDAPDGTSGYLQVVTEEMRERVRAGTGVLLPYVRHRIAESSLPPDGFVVHLDDVPVLRGTARSGTYAVRPVRDDHSPQTGAELTVIHPLTGERGFWAIEEEHAEPVAGGDGNAMEGSLNTTQYVVQQVERVARTYLARQLGPEEVAGLIDNWAQQDDGLFLAGIRDDHRSVLRLTWILQALVNDGISITDWRSIARVVRDTGTAEPSLRTLHRAARTALRARLPGPRSGPRVVRIPEPLQTTLTGARGRLQRVTAEGRLEFLQWLRSTVVPTGPALALIARGDDARETAAALARAEFPLATTFTEDELEAPG
ncbi:FHIPEP family type III secretion protein [Streptomyces sp. NBC_01356]|uniref:FHIPEP family type III secretion protein n=1 Tax=Streptomyces sp. NBC_01356 TaxID=2903836 RepID=UPI002E300BA5|nr:FHIPEP family type III secretion protein [Streptomyces sp. NBC_01356]